MVYKHNLSRLEQSRNTAALVATSFSESGTQASVIEAHYAPNLEGPQTTSDIIALFTTDWVHSIFLARVGRPRRVWRLLKRVVVALAILAKRGQRNRELAVKRSIVGTQLHLLETALNSVADFLMVLEDDAVLNGVRARFWGAKSTHNKTPWRERAMVLEPWGRITRTADC